MANIKVKLGYPIKTGVGFTFHAPCDCTEITGLTVEHPGGTDKFSFVDAHGNILSNINHLFAAGSLVKVVLDLTKHGATIQNADTNAYLEQRLDEASVSVRDQNTDTPMRFWIGTEDEYHRAKDSLAANTLCITTDVCGNYGEVIPTLGAFVDEQELEDALDFFIRETIMSDAQPFRVRFSVQNLGGVTCGSAMWDCDIVTTSSGHAMLTGRSLFTGQGVTRIRKALSGDVWLPVEWENPPMVGGVSYRTTERRHNQPVYVCNINFTIPSVGVDGEPVTTQYVVDMGVAAQALTVVEIGGSVDVLDADIHGNKSYPISVIDTWCEWVDEQDECTKLTVKIRDTAKSFADGRAKVFVKYTT